MSARDTSATAVDELTGQDLYIEYNRLAGRGNRADLRWKEPRLRREIQKLRDCEAERLAREDAATRERIALSLERANRAAERGTFEEFAAKRSRLSGDEGILAHFASRFLKAEEAWQIACRDLAANAEGRMRPTYALECASGIFAAAARADEARALKHIVESGITLQELQDELTSSVMSRASSPARSTSPHMNLLSEERLAVEADLLRDILQWKRAIG